MHPSDAGAGMGEVFPLQEVLPPQGDQPQDLYFAKGSRFALVAEGEIVLEAGARILGDTYFNAFFLNHWARHCLLRRIGLRCRADGDVLVRVWGLGAGEIPQLLGEWSHRREDRESLVWVWETGSQVFARLAVELAAQGPVRVLRVDFVTDRKPRRSPRLAIGLVTHDREALLGRTLSALSLAAGRLPQIGPVIVVNQGRPFRRDDVKRSFSNPAFVCLEQANLGGSGGFARLMLEAQQQGDGVSHLLVMDDDILIDPRILDRALAFVSHAVHDVVLGGQAIELERRTVLQEASGHLGAYWMPNIRGAELDLSDTEALALWDSIVHPDYNGWWFTLFPIAAIRRCGLPMPFFLHYDDIEYGLRLNAAGHPMVPLPGIGVWHASVRFKHLGQMQYYDLRNGLVTAALHPGKAPMPPFIHVLGWVMHHLLLHRYRAASASLLAIRDFLTGPQVIMASDGCDLHKRLLARLEPISAPPIARGSAPDAAERPAPFYAARSPALRYAAAAGQILRVILLPARQDPAILQIGAPDPRHIRARPYLLSLDPDGVKCLVMCPRRRLFILLLTKAVLLSLRYAILAGRAARAWRAAGPFLSAAARWKGAFDRRRD